MVRAGVGAVAGRDAAKLPPAATHLSSTQSICVNHQHTISSTAHTVQHSSVTSNCRAFVPPVLTVHTVHCPFVSRGEGRALDNNHSSDTNLLLLRLLPQTVKCVHFFATSAHLAASAGPCRWRRLRVWRAGGGWTAGRSSWPSWWRGSWSRSCTR